MTTSIKPFDTKSSASSITSLVVPEIKNKNNKTKNNKSIQEDKYTREILKKRLNRIKDNYNELHDIIVATGLPLRHANPPEDITENIVKFVIQNYDNDPSCIWAKSMGLNGDLFSDKYPIESPIEIKAFTSVGPSSFGPDKKFSVIYFLDMRNWLHDIFIVWKVNLTYESPEWKGIKMNKNQTFEDQCLQGKRPHISWDNIYPQISEHCVKLYDGTFEGIFTPPKATI